jgi:hypothetical protein
MASTDKVVGSRLKSSERWRAIPVFLRLDPHQNDVLTQIGGESVFYRVSGR